jgi:hypothetical protein
MASWIHFDDDSVDTRFETVVSRQEIAFWATVVVSFHAVLSAAVCDSKSSQIASFKKRNISLVQLFDSG